MNHIAHRRISIALVALVALALAAFPGAATTQQQPDKNPPLPPNHPQVPSQRPQVPANHPPVQQPPLPAGHPQLPGQNPEEAPDAVQPPPPANPDDVKSIDSIMQAYYASFSGPKGQPRDWTRMRSLMIPETHFVTTRPMDNNIAMPMIMNIDQFIQNNSTYFEKGGYFEKEIHRELDHFGNMAQVFSTYESRRDQREAQAYSRGINSVQLLHDGMRWWIVNVLWDFERIDVNPLPEKYGGTGEGAPLPGGAST